MFRCKYLYAEGDRKVLAGEAKIGDQCGSLRATTKNHGFCGGHLKAWNKLNNPQVNMDIGRKQSDSLRERKNDAIEQNKDIVENSNAILNDLDKEILQVLGKNEKYDLVYEYSLLKRLNPNPQSESYAEKFAFAMWINTPESVRTPKEMEEVAGILGASIATLCLWRRSPELVRIMNNKARQSLVGAFPWVAAKLLKRVAVGSEKAMDIALKYIKEIETEMGANAKTTPADPKLLEEAERINNGNVDKFVGVANQVKKVINYDALVNGDVKPNAIPS